MSLPQTNDVANTKEEGDTNWLKFKHSILIKTETFKTSHFFDSQDIKNHVFLV